MDSHDNDRCPDALAASAGKSPRFVLVVDDHQSVLDAVQMVLEHRGYQVLLALGGAEAVRLYQSHRGEVLTVVTDMMMPGMDGYATIRALRELDPKLRFVGISGSVDPGRIREFRAVGLVTLLQKPFSMHDLIEAIKMAATG
jgi:CheY-like chemotaxis protein